MIYEDSQAQIRERKEISSFILECGTKVEDGIVGTVVL
jgi:hypothetical protein